MNTRSNLLPSRSHLLRMLRRGMPLVCLLVGTMPAAGRERMFPNALQELYPLREFNIQEPQSIGQLPDGRIATVTDSGKLFVFNGTGWQLLPQKLPVGSMKLFSDSEGTLWVGGLGFFGYVDADFQFHDISRDYFAEELDTTLTVLWLYETGDWLHFANNKTLFHLNRKTGQQKTTRFEGMFEAYHWVWDGALYLGGRENIQVWSGERFVHEVDWAHEHQAFVGWHHEGRSYYLNVHSLSVFEQGVEVETLKDPLMQMRGASHVMTEDYLYVFTLQGILRIDRSGSCDGYYTHYYHQPITRANVRFHTHFEGEDLWVLTANAILRTNLTSGIQPLEAASGYPVSGLWDITHFNGSLYTSSNEGLKRWNPNSRQLKLLGDPSPDFETASLWPWNGRLLVSSWIELGSFDGEHYQIHRPDGSYRVFARARFPDHFWVSRDTGALLLNADFEIVREIQFPREIISMVEFQGQLWVTTLFGDLLSFEIESGTIVQEFGGNPNAPSDPSLRNLQRVFTHGGRLFLQRHDAILEWDGAAFNPLPLPLEADWRWEIPQCCNDAERIVLLQRHEFLPGAKIGEFIAEPETREVQWEPRLVPVGSPSGFVRGIKFLEGSDASTVAILSQSMVEWIDLSRYPARVQPPPAPTLVKPVAHFGQSDPSPFEGSYRVREDLPLVVQLHCAGNALETPLQFRGRLLGKTDWIQNPSGSFAFYGILRGTQIFEGYSVDPFGNRSPVVRREIRVIPPWFLSNAAIAGYTLCFILCIFLVAQWQTRRLRGQARRLQERVDQRTEELLKANEAKSIFVSNVSHEIRNPLNGLLGLAQTLKAGDVLDGPTLERLRRPSLYLYRFLSNVLDFSKFESGGIRFTPRIMDPYELLDSVQSMFSGDFESRNLHFIADYRAEGNPFVVASQEAIEMILVNLVGNAVKYTPEGGRIRLAMWKSEGVLRFSVADTGTGIAPQDLNRIFEPYEQGGHAPLVSGEKGAGIGLSLVRHSLHQLGGTIVVHSRPGEGSRFSVSLPVEEPKGHHAPVEVDDVRLKGRFLIVEDLEYNRKLFSDLLQSWGASVVEAANAAETRQHLNGNEFDMVFMDYDLPDGNGVQLTRECRSNGHLQDTPIVGLSAYTDQEFIQSALRAGMSDYLFKPLNPQQLVECIHALLPGHITFSQKSASTHRNPRSSLHRLWLTRSEEAAGLQSQIDAFEHTLDALVRELNACDLGSERFHSIVHQLKGLSSYVQHHSSVHYWKSLMGLTESRQREALLDAMEQLPDILQSMKLEIRGLESLEHDYHQLRMEFTSA